jgi:hypothetical protein
MKLKYALIALLTGGLIISTGYGDDEPLCGKKCENSTAKCEKDTGGGGQCEWEGGSVCTGQGDCPFDDGVQPTVKDATCEDADPLDKCKLVDNREFWDNKCKVYCKILPFLSCNCYKTGDKTGVLWVYHAKGC